MTTFPSLTPSSRTFTPSVFPHASMRTLGGSQHQVRHSNSAVGAILELSFQSVTANDLLAIRVHFIKVAGLFEAFTLPAEVWSGTQDATLVNNTWQYTDRPTASESGCGFYTVAISLRSIV